MKDVPKEGLRREAKRRQHKTYYAKTAFIYASRPWLPSEDEQVIAHSIPDSELCEKIQRSLKAIQNRRWRLKKQSRAKSIADDKRNVVKPKKWVAMKGAEE